MGKKTDSILLEGLKSALIAFLITLVISLGLSLILNFSVFERFNELMSGTLGGNKGVTASSILKITIMILNFSLFNTVGGLTLGALVLIFIPAIAFWLANKSIDDKGSIDFTNIKVYLIASVIFAFLQFCFSFITAGDIVKDLTINFATIRNFISTVIITFLIQLFIKINYKTDGDNNGLKAFKYTYRTMAIIGAIVGLVAIIIGLKSYSKDIMLLLFSIIVILPNAIAYTCFYMMGLTIEFNDKLQGALNYIGLDPTLQNMMFVRYLGAIVFVLIIIVFIYRMKKEKLIINTAIYSISLGLFMGVLSYCSRINIIQIPILGTITFGVNSFLLSVLIPIVTIWVITLIYCLVMKVVEIIKQ